MPGQIPDSLSVFLVLRMNDAAVFSVRVNDQMVPLVVVSALSACRAPGGGLIGFLLDVFEF